MTQAWPIRACCFLATVMGPGLGMGPVIPVKLSQDFCGDGRFVLSAPYAKSFPFLHNHSKVGFCHLQPKETSRGARCCARPRDTVLMGQTQPLPRRPQPSAVQASPRGWPGPWSPHRPALWVLPAKPGRLGNSAARSPHRRARSWTHIPQRLDFGFQILNVSTVAYISCDFFVLYQYV